MEPVVNPRAEKQSWAQTLKVGDIVCDCRFIHSKIKELDAEYDYIEFEDGFRCSIINCCDDISMCMEGTPCANYWRKKNEASRS